MSWCCCSNRPASDEEAGVRADVRVPMLPLGKQHEKEDEPVRIKIETPGRSPGAPDEPNPEAALEMYRAAQQHSRACPHPSALKHSESSKSHHSHLDEAAAPTEGGGACPFAEKVLDREESHNDKLAPLANDACCPIVGWADETGSTVSMDQVQMRRSSADSTRSTHSWRRTSSINKRVSFGGTCDSEVRVPHRIDSKKRQMGQEVSMKKIVDMLYKKVVDDPQLAPFFHNMPLDRLKHMQTASLTTAFGGELPYGSNGPDLRQVHMHLIRDEGLGLRHWELWMKHFQETLDELPEVPPEQKENALRCVRATRHYFKPLHSGETPRSSVSSR